MYQSSRMLGSIIFRLRGSLSSLQLWPFEGKTSTSPFHPSIALSNLSLPFLPSCQPLLHLHPASPSACCSLQRSFTFNNSSHPVHLDLQPSLSIVKSLHPHCILLFSPLCGGLSHFCISLFPSLVLFNQQH